MNEIIAEIDKALETSRRKKLSCETISKMVGNLKESDCFVSWCSANHATEGAGLTHVGLAVRYGEFIYLGFAEGYLQGASPGRTWAELKPWNTANSTMPEKIRSWTKNQKNKIALNEIDLFCENIKKLKNASHNPSMTDKNFVMKEGIRI